MWLSCLSRPSPWKPIPHWLVPPLPPSAWITTSCRMPFPTHTVGVTWVESPPLPKHRAAWLVRGCACQEWLQGFHLPAFVGPSLTVMHTSKTSSPTRNAGTISQYLLGGWRTAKHSTSCNPTPKLVCCTLMRQILLGTVGCLLSLPSLWSQHHSITTMNDKVGAKPTREGWAGLKPIVIYDSDCNILLPHT